jgi:hypothetical protein
MGRVKGAAKYSLGAVTHVDFSGKVKRVKFHFNKTSPDCDEWIPFSSKRIAALDSKTTPASKKRKLDVPENESNKVLFYFMKIFLSCSPHGIMFQATLS